MQPEFHRIRRLPPYVFEEVNRLKARLRAEGVDIIDFGMGNPDMPTPKHIVDKLVETARDPKAGRYSASKGIVGLRRAMAGYYGRRFGVKLDPDTEVIATLGSKEGFANLAQALTAPGDVIICPDPAYPIHAYGFIMAGGVIRHGAGALAGAVPVGRQPGGEPLGAAGQRPGGELSLEPDRPVGRPRFLQGRRGAGAEARHAGAVRHRLFGDLLRRQSAAVDPAGRRRARPRGRGQSPLQDLRHGRLARRHGGGQRADVRGPGAGEELSRLWRLHCRSRWPRPRR